MKAIEYTSTEKALTKEKIQTIIENFKIELNGKVTSAYLFGSTSTGEFKDDSDIDLIIIDPSPDENFIERPLKYKSLFKIWPKLDLLVYSQKEFDDQLKDSDSGFWYSAKQSLKKIL
jgi:predicted nucleotidyltransferase